MTDSLVTVRSFHRRVRYLVATDSVHTTAAACDYLDPRVDPGDQVDVLTVVEPDDGGPGASQGAVAASRDAGDAANVAAARLAGRAAVESLTREGSPVGTVLAVAEGRDADVVLVGLHGGRPGAGPGLGSVARRVLEGVDRPVVVLPLEPLDPPGDGP
jgi:nucleotide-binding universal stress UspA family protein